MQLFKIITLIFFQNILSFGLFDALKLLHMFKIAQVGSNPAKKTFSVK